MPRYDLVVFDFDGTLADSLAVFRQAFDRAARAQGVDPAVLAQLDRYRGLEPRALLRRLGLPLWRVPALTLQMRHAMSERVDEVELFAGATDLLRALRRYGVRTALVSSNAQENAERVLGHKYAAMIDGFGCGATIFGKRRKLREVLAAFEIAPARVLCVGDEIRDAQAAAGLGLDFAGVAWGFATPAALAPHCRLGPCADFATLQAAILGPSG